MKITPNERYTLTLTHEYIESDGSSHHIDEPIKVSSIIRFGDVDLLTCPPATVVINDMLDKMRRYLFQKEEE